MTGILIAIMLIVSAPSFAEESGVSVGFSPESEKFADAARTYQMIWHTEGKRIIEAMEDVSGMKFQESNIQVIVFEGISRSGWKDSPMKLRASYPTDVKKATLIHELGHRLSFQLTNRPKDLDNHRILYLYLYDVWARLYGEGFADQQVEIEKNRTPPFPFKLMVGYDYRSAWKWALSLSANERSSKLREIVNNNKTGG